MGETEEFNTLTFEKRLMHLKDTQECIQSLSSWCLKQKNHHKKIVSSWLNVLKRVKVEQRLTLFYLANDVIQYSKRKGYDFVESWGHNLQKATPLVRDEKVRPKILRIFKIWEQRTVYDDEFLSDLTGLLSAGATKKTDDDPLDFQPQQLVNKIKQCTVLEADAELKLKELLGHDLQLSDAEELCAHLKDRSLKHDVIKELNEGISCVERYTQALQREIVARETLLALLTSANQYYATQRGEVKVVAYAYKNFGSRVRALKRKLDELLPTLPSSAPSPPQRDEDVPSPGPDEDLDLPLHDGENDLSYNIDQTFNTSISADGSLYNLGLSSFLTSDNPLAIFNDTIDLDSLNENSIEVINTRADAQPSNIIDCLLKDIVTIDGTPPDNVSDGVVASSLSLKSQDALPGLDLLTPDSTGNPPPPISFYGTMDSLNEEADVSFVPEPVTHPWADNTPSPVDSRATWLPAPSSARSVFAEPPASPPPGQRAPLASATRPHVRQDPPPADVDQRGLLPPPPPPPMLPLLGHTEDVDHRLLAPSAAPLPRHTAHQDIDHRNLISLTHQPAAQHNAVSMDQDYRVPPLMPPLVPVSDIVESVDMDLSEDEEQGMYQAPSSRLERRNSFNNNKVLVGGDEHASAPSLVSGNMNSIPSNRQEAPLSAPSQLPPSLGGPHYARAPPIASHSALPITRAAAMPKIVSTVPHVSSTVPHMSSTVPQMGSTLPHMTSTIPHAASTIPRNISHVPPPTNHSATMAPQAGAVPQAVPRPQSDPVMPPLTNPFDNMPPSLKFNMPNFQTLPPNYQGASYDKQDDFDSYEDDLRNRGLETVEHAETRNPSPPEYADFGGSWSNQDPRPTQRFPRNWTPRTNFRPNFSPQFRPRGSPARPPNRWPGPRGQRFW